MTDQDVTRSVSQPRAHPQQQMEGPQHLGQPQRPQSYYASINDQMSQQPSVYQQSEYLLQQPVVNQLQRAHSLQDYNQN